MLPVGNCELLRSLRGAEPQLCGLLEWTFPEELRVWTWLTLATVLETGRTLWPFGNSGAFQ